MQRGLTVHEAACEFNCPWLDQCFILLASRIAWYLGLLRVDQSSSLSI